ncbi:MAG: glycosyltransferase family 39 protein [Gammaproteobacteria bacterium]|nr:glycosyltransferase family 39 protein [Gammaproteobacteria bacterium]
MFQLFGTGLLALTLLKYLLIGLTFWFTWLSTGYLFQHQQSRWLAVSAFLLMPSFAWHMHQGFTHTLLLGLAIATTLHALLRLQQSYQIKDYLYLGIALGIGIMAKYSFLLFMVPLLLSALSIQALRRQLLQTQILFTLIAVLVITAPHLYWLSQHYLEVFPIIDQKLRVTAGNSLLERFQSLWLFLTSALAFVTPWLLLFILLSGKQLFAPSNSTPATQLLSRFYLILLAIVILLSLFFTMPHFKVRWFHPLMMLFPLWWLTQIESDAPLNTIKTGWIIGITATFTLLIITIRLLQATIGPELGHYGRLNRPIIETLEQHPKPPTTTLLITKDDFLGAHLLAHYSKHAVAIVNTLYNRSLITPFQNCLLLYDNDDHFSPSSLINGRKTKRYMNEQGGVQYRLDIAEISYTECLLIINDL